jgi:hypothetical protein
VSPRRALAVAAAVAVVALAGCGGDDDGPSTAATDYLFTAPETTTGGLDEAEPETGTTTTGTAPEGQPGGVGDEVPASSPAQLTGRGGQISPSEVHVPPFIAIAVELRSADGREYSLTFPGQRAITARPGEPVRLMLDGLRPGRDVVGRPAGAGPAVRIVADAEPGP